jgi:hypothetical protein
VIILHRLYQEISTFFAFLLLIYILTNIKYNKRIFIVYIINIRRVGYIV